MVGNFGGLLMNDDIKARTLNTAKFWYESSKFFNSLSLLAEAISNELINLGYKLVDKSYGLKFAASDPGGTRLVYDRIKNHWFGEFTLGDSVSCFPKGTGHIKIIISLCKRKIFTLVSSEILEFEINKTSDILR